MESLFEKAPPLTDFCHLCLAFRVWLTVAVRSREHCFQLSENDFRRTRAKLFSNGIVDYLLVLLGVK